MTISEYIKAVRGNRKQEEFGKLIFPNDDPVRARNRIAKYEGGWAMPPADVFLRIQALDNKMQCECSCKPILK